MTHQSVSARRPDRSDCRWAQNCDRAADGRAQKATRQPVGARKSRRASLARAVHGDTPVGVRASVGALRLVLAPKSAPLGAGAMSKNSVCASAPSLRRRARQNAPGRRRFPARTKPAADPPRENRLPMRRVAKRGGRINRNACPKLKPVRVNIGARSIAQPHWYNRRATATDGRASKLPPRLAGDSWPKR